MSRKFIFGGSFTSFVFDPDALAYFAVNSAITSDADKLAIDAFYKGLKADGIYNDIRAMYLPIWGSATTCKWNLKDPRDLNAAFRLSFFGGWTYTSSGADPNGTTGYADTYFTPNTWNDEHLSFYSGQATYQANTIDIGCLSNANNRYFLTASLNNSQSPHGAFGNPLLNNTNSSEGFFCVTANGTSVKLYKANSIIDTDTATSAGPAVGTVHLSRGNGVGFYSNREVRFASFGFGLTDTQQSNLYLRVQTLLTHFGLNL